MADESIFAKSLRVFELLVGKLLPKIQTGLTITAIIIIIIISKNYKKKKRPSYVCHIRKARSVRIC